MFAQIAEGMAARGCPPGSYDDAEIWEVAAALGSNRDPNDDDGTPRIEEVDPVEFRHPAFPA